MADYIKTELAKYNLPDAKIAELKSKYLKYKVRDLEDIDNYLACKSAHQEVKAIRVKIEKDRVGLKAESVAFGRAIDTEAKRLTAGIIEVENHLVIQRKIIEDEKKRIQEERERKEREEQERLKKEEESRLETIRLEQEKKEKELKEAQEKIDEANRKIEEEKEKIRLDKEKTEKEKVEVEEAKVRAEQAEEDRKEREAIHALEVEQAKKDAAEKAIKDEQERVEKEKKEKELTELRAKEAKIEADKKASDKDKLLELAKVLSEIEFPKVKSDESEDILVKVNELLKQAQKLLKAC